jgi:hypothetical protein
MTFTVISASKIGAANQAFARLRRWQAGLSIPSSQRFSLRQPGRWAERVTPQSDVQKLPPVGVIRNRQQRISASVAKCHDQSLDRRLASRGYASHEKGPGTKVPETCRGRTSCRKCKLCSRSSGIGPFDLTTELACQRSDNCHAERGRGCGTRRLGQSTSVIVPTSDVWRSCRRRSPGCSGAGR